MQQFPEQRKRVFELANKSWQRFGGSVTEKYFPGEQITVKLMRFKFIISSDQLPFGITIYSMLKTRPEVVWLDYKDKLIQSYLIWDPDELVELKYGTRPANRDDINNAIELLEKLLCEPEFRVVEWEMNL